MKVKITCIFLLMLIVITSSIYSAELLKIEEAVELAESENYDLELAKIEYQKAEIDLEKLEIENKYNFTETQELEINRNYLNSEKNYQDSKANIIKSIIQQYTNLWLQQKEIEAQQLTVQAEKRLLSEMEARFELSEIDRIELLDQSNNFNEANNKLEDLKDNYEQSLLEFKKDINLKNEEVEIGELKEPEIWSISENEALDKGLKNSNDLKIAEIDYNLAEKKYNRNIINASKSEQKKAELDLKSAEISLYKTEEDLKNDIVKAYLNLEQTKKKIDLMKDNLEKAESEFGQVKKQYELESATKTALLQYEASLLNSEYQLKSAYLEYYLAEEELADLLNLEPGVSINEQQK